MDRVLSRREAIGWMGGAVVAPWLQGGSERPGATAPNILFVMTDDQRRDAMSAYEVRRRFSGFRLRGAS